MHRKLGFTLLEVMVTLLILMFGLLGIAGLMAKGQRASYEAYQRQQALAIANDMVERLRGNPAQNQVYIDGAPVGTPLGTGSTLGAPPNCITANCAAGVVAQYDLAMWNRLLQGAAEQSAAGNVGSVVGARGCIEESVPASACPSIPAPPFTFYTRTVRVSVAWQGQEDNGALNAPPSACGAASYGAAGQRRLVSMDVMIRAQCP